MTEIRKVILTPEVEATLLAMSARWEEENISLGLRRNTAEDLVGYDLFLADAEGTTVGYLMCHTEMQSDDTAAIPSGSTILEVDELYILPEHRSQGIGRKLYQIAVDSYGDELDYVTLATSTKDYKSILHFYIEELGMTFWHACFFQKR